MDRVTVTTDLLEEPWTDVVDPPFGTVERLGLVKMTGDQPSSVALLIRTEKGPVVAMLELSLYVKASTALMKAVVCS
jgi:hypothetical protein